MYVNILKQYKMKKLSRNVIILIILSTVLSTVLIIMSTMYFRTSSTLKDSNAFIKDKESEISVRNVIIKKFESVNDSIINSNKILTLRIDSLKLVKHNIYITPTKQISDTPEQAYKEMIKELNKYRDEKSK